MAERIGYMFNRSTKHRGETGNAVIDALMETVLATDADGDVIMHDTGPWDTLYTKFKVAYEGATGALEVSVGVRALHGDFVDPDYFGVVTLAAGDGEEELIIAPKYVVDADGKKINHEIILTLGGTLTATESFWTVSEKLCFGAPV